MGNIVAYYLGLRKQQSWRNREKEINISSAVLYMDIKILVDIIFVVFHCNTENKIKVINKSILI